MPLDPSIILQGRNQVPDYGEVYGRALSLRSLRNQSKLQDAALAKTVRLRDLQKGAVKDGKFDPEAYAGALEAEGYADEALATRKGYGELAGQGAITKKTEAETEKAASEKALKDYELHAKKGERVAQILSTATDQPSYERAMSLLTQEGVPIDKLPPVFDQARIKQLAQGALTLKERADLAIAQQNADTSAGHLKVAQGNLAVNQAELPIKQKTAEAAIQANNVARTAAGVTASTGLRKEFEDLPDIKNYRQAVPAYKAIRDAAERNTPQSDINLVYGIAKLYDPNSVVREGEYATVANSPSIPDRIKGYAQYLKGGGRLTPEVKAQIVDEANGRMSSFEEGYKARRADYSDISARSGADPSLLFPSEYDPLVPPRVNSVEEAMALPPGTVFITPDGRQKVAGPKKAP